MAKIYCAGPLFNELERAEMVAIADAFKAAGHETFLPQRDGLEARELAEQLGREIGNSAAAVRLHHQAIFSLDVYRLLEWSDAVVANLNGRVPDEGTVVECALAWHGRKPLVIYKDDARAPFDGNDNPMITGLVKTIVGRLDLLPAEVEAELQVDHGDRVATTIKLGEQVRKARDHCESNQDLGRVIVQLMTR